MLLNDVADYLVLNLGTLTLGIDLYMGNMPEESVNCVGLFEYDGLSPIEVMGDNAYAPVEMPRLQVVVRNESYATGRQLSQQIWKSIGAIADQIINTNRYLRIAAVGSVNYLGRGKNREAMWSMNFQVWKETE